MLFPALRRNIQNVLGVILFLLLCPQTEAMMVTVSGQDLNLRAGPGRTYDIVDVVHSHEKFEVLEEQEGWYKISVEGRIGWISAKGVSTSSGDRVATLLARADDYFRQRQFTTPTEANAFDLYQEVLQTDPNNRHALEQIQEMARIYKRWADAAVQRGDQETAQIYYERYRFVAPEEDSDQPLSDLADPPQQKLLSIYHLRTTPAVVSPETLHQMIRAHQFHHPADWSKYGFLPSLSGTIRHDYERLTTPQGVVVIVDYATNLMWQHRSPATPVTWHTAHIQIQHLNTTHYGGFADWRLPTLEELASLMEPKKSPQNLYLDPIFGTTQLWCWSADPVAGVQEQAWYVSFSSGGIQPHAIQNTAFVLAVRSIQEPSAPEHGPTPDSY